MSERPLVAVVIVSYNVRDELARCLQSLVGETRTLGATITVVDNGSSDGTRDEIRRHWPDVQLIEPGGNVGFARGNNAGVKATDSEYVLLLNPDTVVGPGAVATLVDALAARPDAAAVGPRLVDDEGKAELSFGWAISPIGELRQKALGALYRRDVPIIAPRVARWTRTPGPREWLSGACLLLRRADLEAVGLFDERYFMYTEDVDLCLALRRRGRTILFVPDAEVLHLRGRSARRNPQTERLRRRSQLAYYEKHHRAWAPLLRIYLRLRSRDYHSRDQGTAGDQGGRGSGGRDRGHGQGQGEGAGKSGS